MRVAMSALRHAGIRPIGMNFRSCSGVLNRQPRFYHSGETGDLSLVVDHLRRIFPGRKLGALGFSLGGNVLLRYLAESSGAPPPHLRAAAAISVPYDLAEGSRALESSWMGRRYASYFLNSLQAKAQAKRRVLSDVVDIDRVLKAHTLREFDEVATAPLHGFRDAADYYQRASSKPVLGSIRVPTHLFHAMDDPFLPTRAVPRRQVTENPWLLGSFPPRGGHVGFVENGSVRQPRFWAESEAVRYLATVLRGRPPVG